MPSAPACAIPRNEGAMITSHRRVVDTPLTPLRFSGGENISSVELEQALLSHPAVAEVAVIGVPDDEKGEEICAVVIAAPSESGPPDPDELIAWSREHLGRHKYPRRVEVLDALPMGPSHKVLKRELRTRFSGPLPRPVDPQEGTA